jgi:hypothetical protein
MKFINVSKANLLWAILFILLSRAFGFELLAAPGLGHDSVQYFFGCKFDPKKTIIGRWVRRQLKLRNK